MLAFRSRDTNHDAIRDIDAPHSRRSWFEETGQTALHLVAQSSVPQDESDSSEEDEEEKSISSSGGSSAATAAATNSRTKPASTKSEKKAPKRATCSTCGCCVLTFPTAAAVRLLRDHGADPNAAASVFVEAPYPLHQFTIKGDAPAVKALLAEPDWVAACGAFAPSQIRIDGDIIPFLCDVNLRLTDDPRSEDVLEGAIEHDEQWETAGRTALHWAADKGRVEIARRLIYTSGGQCDVNSVSEHEDLRAVEICVQLRDWEEDEKENLAAAEYKREHGVGARGQSQSQGGPDGSGADADSASERRFRALERRVAAIKKLQADRNKVFKLIVDSPGHELPAYAVADGILDDI